MGAEASMRQAATTGASGTPAARRAELYGLLGVLPDRQRPVTTTKLREEARDGYVLEHWVFDLNGIEPVPAYVARPGVAPAEVFAIIHDAGGVASLAHPGVTRRDDRLEAWAAAGLDALEAYHSDHSEAEVTLYLERAAALGLLVTGGSDFHGDDPMSHRARRRVVGGVTLPPAAWQALSARRPGAARRV